MAEASQYWRRHIGVVIDVDPLTDANISAVESGAEHAVGRWKVAR
jgi:hypothetical protein